MIRLLLNADIFKVNADALINPVNCVGVMGKGLALQFKTRYPTNFHRYVNDCRTKQLTPGGITAFREKDGPVIINFATKNHWKNPSNLDYIKNGCKALAAYLTANPDVRTVAMPKIGCGCGGLNWADVRPLVEEYLEELPQTIYVCL